MKLRAAIALLALAVPAFAQHGTAHGGSFGSRGFAGHAGFSGHSGFSANSGLSHSGSFARSAPPVRFGTYGGARMRGPGMPNYSGRPFSSFGNRPNAFRPSYGSMTAAHSRNWDRSREHDWDRDRFAARRRSFANWYLNLYPGWLGYGYPLLLNPGFLDWGDSDSVASDQSGAAPYSPAPYEDYGESASGAPPPDAYPQAPAIPLNGQYAATQSSALTAPVSVQPLTVMFKDGRTPVTMQNYLMTARFLTDLDSQHYAQIPMEQVDVGATQRANRAAGVGFEVPGTSRD